MLRRDTDEAAAAAVEEVTRRRPCATKTRKRSALSSPSGGSSDALRKLRLKRGVVLFRWRGSSSPCRESRKKMSESVSARKLVRTLWQMNEGGLLEEEEEAGVPRDAAAARCASSVEISKRSRTKSKALDADHGEWFSDKLSNGGTIGVHACAADSSSEDRMARLQDMYHSLTASKELVRVLGNILGPRPGVLNPSTASLLSALCSELDHARAHARQLAKEQSRRSGSEVELLKRRLAAEARAWKSRQREKVAATMRVVADELEGEKRSRLRAERVNAKLGKALAETGSSLEAAERELERERRERERLEKVCDELVRGGTSSSSSRAHEELDKEQEMLRLADELREERVQMKLLEARLQLEGKNVVVERLRGELEAFLETKMQDHKESPSAADASHDHHASEAEAANGIARVAVSKNTDGESHEVDSQGSDMHSIELNIEGNIKDCGWSYSTAANSRDMSTTSKKGTECAVDPWACASFDRRSLEESERGQQWKVNNEGCNGTTRDMDEDSERYQAIKNLREQMLAGHGFIFMSPADQGVADREQHSYGVI
uniref:Uncharacterized protein n=1 Tax=Avena sativa TaxID=4498 RepID=A0ACD6ANN8_AVESA